LWKERAKLQKADRVYLMPLSGTSTAPITLLGVHRSISLAQAYNVSCIIRFITGALSYDQLTNEQKGLFSGQQPINAVNYIKDLLGAFGIDLTGSADNETQKQIKASNFKALRTKYRLFKKNAAYSFLPAIWCAYQKFDKSNAKGLTHLEQNLLYMMRQDISSKTTGSKGKMGIVLRFKIANNKYAKFFVDYANGTYSIYKEKASNDKPWDSFTDTQDGIVATVSVNNSNPNLDLKALVAEIKKKDQYKNFGDFTEETLKNGSVSFYLSQRVVSTGSDNVQRTNYFLPTDYDFIQTALRDLTAGEFKVLDQHFKEFPAFKNGIFLNDAISGDDTKDSVFKTLNISQDAEDNRVSDAYRVVPPVFKVKVDLDTDLDTSAKVESLFEDVSSTSSTNVDTGYDTFESQIKETLIQNLPSGKNVTAYLTEDFKKQFKNDKNTALTQLNQKLQEVGLSVIEDNGAYRVQRVQSSTTSNVPTVNDVMASLEKELDQLSLDKEIKGSALGQIRAAIADPNDSSKVNTN